MAGGNGSRKGEPEEVRGARLSGQELGKAIPYGVYDLSHNQGWVSVGIDHDTAQFAAEAIRALVAEDGSERYPAGQRTADHRRRRRQQRQPLPAVESGPAGPWPTSLGLPFCVCHFPPGTSKWNKIEHRLFSFITQNWRGRPLVSHQVIVNLIANTKTRTGLRIRAELDSGKYPTGIKVSDAEFNALNLKHAAFHGDWNYAILPPRRK